MPSHLNNGERLSWSVAMHTAGGDGRTKREALDHGSVVTTSESDIWRLGKCSEQAGDVTTF